MATTEHQELHRTDTEQSQSILESQVTDANESQDARRELVFVDPAAADVEQLLEDLWSESDPTRDFEVVLLSNDRDGIEQISEKLSEYQDLNAIHIVSHGTEGAVKLGDSWLNLGNVGGYAGQLVGWRDALAADADLLFYGCELAGNEDGRTLVESLSTLCDCDVAASTDDTGHALLGGDWDFEYTTGAIEAELAFSLDIEQNWSQLMTASSPGTAIWAESGSTVVQAVTRAVTYDNVSGDPSTATRTVEFQLTDGDGGTSAVKTKSINVVAVNDNPTITSATAATVTENTTAVMTVTATDPETDPITYHITGGVDAAFFAIDNSTGALSFNTAPDFEGPADSDGDNAYLVEVAARDDLGNEGSLTVTVTVSDVNEAPVTADWYDANWQYRKAVNVAAANVAGSLRDFPMLVSITADAELAAKGLANGDDILFTSADGSTKLAHEIESYNGTTGALRVWVKTDLSAGSDTVLYIYYGNGPAAPQQDPTNVWGSNYVGVWHLDEAPDSNGVTNEILDSTSNAQHGNTEGAIDATDLVTAKIGQGIDFDSVDAGLIRIADSGSLDATALSGSFELWINFDNAADGDHQIIMSSSNRFSGGPNDGFEWASQGDGDHFFYPWGGDGSNYNLGPNPFTDGQWHHLAVNFAYDQQQAGIFVDGVEMSYTNEFVATYWDTLANPADWLWGGCRTAARAISME